MVVAAFVLSIVAIFISLWSAWATHRAALANERLANIESARRADEQRTAQLANLRLVVRKELGSPTKHGHSNRDYYLDVINDGPNVARRLRLSFEKIDHDMGIPSLGRDDEGDIAELRPGERRTWYLIVTLADSSRWRCRTQWTDEAGEHAETRELALP